MKKTLQRTLAFGIVLLLLLGMVPSVFAGSEPYPTNFDPDLFAQNVAISRANAAEGMVLMENNGILPLAPGTNVAVFGICAMNTIKGGGGSGDVNTYDADLKKIDQGLEDSGLILDTAVRDWYNTPEVKTTNGRTLRQTDLAIADGLVEAAAERTDTAIYVLGRTSSEGGDRTINGNNPYNLTTIERANFDRVFAEFEHVVVILNEGAVSDVGWIDDYNPDALLFAGLGGHAGGAAVGDIVTGLKNPSGKFVDTWAYDVNDYPARNNFSSAGSTENAFYTSIINGNGTSTSWTAYPAVAHVEDIYVGYRYFETFDIPVKYEFGYGMSYTTFSLTGMSAKVVGDNLEAQVTVTNTGSVPGKEVVQLYMSAPDGTLEKPAKELKGYAKTDELNPGTSQTITISTPLYWLTSYSEDLEAWILDAGKYNFYMGTSVKQVDLAGSWTLDEMRVVEESATGNAATEPKNGRKIDFPVLSKFDDAATRAQKLEKFVLPTAADPRTLINPTTESGYLGLYPGSKWFYTSQDEVPADWTDWSNSAGNFARNQDDFYDRRINSNTGARTLLDVYNNTVTMEAFIRQLSINDLSQLFTGSESGQGPQPLLYGAAWYTVANDTFGIPMTSFPDGPAGLRITMDTASNSAKPDPSGYNRPGQPLRDKNNEIAVQKATMFPQGTLNAQTWNPDLVFNAGQAVGDEMVHFGGHFWLAPGMNIHRDPLNGRNFEYYSEDPFLSGSIAAAMARGVQASGGVSTVIKHFYANNQEYRRTSVDTLMTNRAAREIYLRNFEFAVKEANPRGIMTSYNHVNGEHPNQNVDLTRKLVHDEWGFNGVMMWDHGAYGDGALSVPSGVHWIMPIASGGRLIQLENYVGANRTYAETMAKEVLTEIMHTRAFTDANGLEPYVAPAGTMNVQNVTKSEVKTEQTAGITAPSVYGPGTLSYTITLDKEHIGANNFTVTAQFDTTQLEYVDSEILFEDGGFLGTPSFNTTTGEYKAVFMLLQPGSVIKAPTILPILKINFNIKDGSMNDITGTLTGVKVIEILSGTGTNTVTCDLSPIEAVSKYGPYDINGDGKITMEDVSLIIYNYYMVGEGHPKWEEGKVYDVDGDGLVTITDIMTIAVYVEE